MGERIGRLQAWFSAWSLGVRSGSVAERALRATTFLLVAAGLLLRARGFFWPGPGNSLWLDEASWALKLIEEPLAEHVIRPIAFMAITKALISIIGPYGTLFRLLPWIAGVATTLMAVPLGRRLFRSEAARLLFASVIILIPSAIDLSKDFKPYALGLAFHMGMLLMALRYRDTGAKRDLVGTCALIVPSVLFAQDTIFAYPGLFVFLAYVSWRGGRRRHLAGTAAAALATLSLVAGMYFFVWNRIESKSEEKYWGEKYDVFYVKRNNPNGKLDWFVRHYTQLAEFPGERREIWNDRLPEKARLDLQHLDRTIWFALHVAGLTVLLRERRFVKLLLLLGPIAVMSAFNVAGRWPFGHFRTNLFALVYFAAVAAAAIDRRPARTRGWDLLPATVLVFLPLLLLEKKWHSQKEAWWMAAASWFEEGAVGLVSHHTRPPSGRRELLVMDHYACHSARYYTQYNPITKKTFGKELNERFVPSKCQGSPKNIIKEVRRDLNRGHPHVWMFIGSELIIKGIDAEWPDDLEMFVDLRFDDAHQLVAGVRKKPVAVSAAAVN